MNHIKNLNHITFICKDINKTAELFKKIFGAVECYSNKEKLFSISKERFFKIGDMWFVTMEGDPIDKTYNHIAFQCDAKNFTWITVELEKLGINILEGRDRKKEEGQSLYFYDYDNHLFELHSGDLDKRIKYYKDCDSEGKV